jgi:hypothetical protein
MRAVKDSPRIAAFLAPIPMWIRFVLLGASTIAAMVWGVERDVVVLGDRRFGFVVCWLALTVPTGVAIYLAAAIAWMRRRRRARQDFPRAIVRRKA